MDRNARPRVQVRSVFLSDIHLGACECRADLLLEFLHQVHMEQLFLVGDVVDVWSLRRSFYGPQLHNDVLRTLQGQARHTDHLCARPAHAGHAGGRIRQQREVQPLMERAA